MAVEVLNVIPQLFLSSFLHFARDCLICLSPVAKAAITAVILSPPNNALYLGSTAALENALRPFPRPWPLVADAARAKIEGELFTIVFNSAKLWVPINTLSWYFLPTHFRMLTISIVNVGWNAYISLVQHR
jgi:hypothetical protein